MTSKEANMGHDRTTETSEMTQKHWLSFPRFGHKCALTEMESRRLLPGSVATHISFQSEFQPVVRKHQVLLINILSKAKPAQLSLPFHLWNMYRQILWFVFDRPWETLPVMHYHCPESVSVQLVFCTPFNLLPRSDFEVISVKIGQRCARSESASRDLRLYNLASILT